MNRRSFVRTVSTTGLGLALGPAGRGAATEQTRRRRYAIVGYDTGATLSYSLNAFNAWEGYQAAFNGTLGRLEHTVVERVHSDGTARAGAAGVATGVRTRVIPLRGSPRDIEPWAGEGSHGGADAVMLDDLFLPEPPVDTFLRAADERSGVWSMLIGAAANNCFATGQPVRIADLVTGLERPDYSPMPRRDGPLPMPKKV